LNNHIQPQCDEVAFAKVDTRIEVREIIHTVERAICWTAVRFLLLLYSDQQGTAWAMAEIVQRS